MENDIVKKGQMYLKKPSANTKIRLRAWVERYIVLRDSTFDRGATLEIYNDADHVGDTMKVYDVIDLKDLVRISSYEDSTKYPHALLVSRDGHSALILASENEDTVRGWLVAIRCLAEKERSQDIPRKQSPSKSESYSKSTRKRSSVDPPAIFQDILNGKFNNNKAKNTSFPVEVQINCSSLQYKLHGDYKMQIRADTIALVDIETGKDVYKWPILNLKKFKSETSIDNVDLVTLESGLTGYARVVALGEARPGKHDLCFTICDITSLITRILTGLDDILNISPGIKKSTL